MALTHTSRKHDWCDMSHRATLIHVGLLSCAWILGCISFVRRLGFSDPPHADARAWGLACLAVSMAAVVAGVVDLKAITDRQEQSCRRWIRVGVALSGVVLSFLSMTLGFVCGR